MVYDLTRVIHSLRDIQARLFQRRRRVGPQLGKGLLLVMISGGDAEAETAALLSGE